MANTNATAAFVHMSRFIAILQLPNWKEPVARLPRS
jgi:hypothetical protein